MEGGGSSAYVNPSDEDIFQSYRNMEAKKQQMLANGEPFDRDVMGSLMKAEHERLKCDKKTFKTQMDELKAKSKEFSELQRHFERTVASVPRAVPSVSVPDMLKVYIEATDRKEKVQRPFKDSRATIGGILKKVIDDFGFNEEIFDKSAKAACSDKGIQYDPEFHLFKVQYEETLPPQAQVERLNQLMIQGTAYTDPSSLSNNSSVDQASHRHKICSCCLTTSNNHCLQQEVTLAKGVLTATSRKMPSSQSSRLMDQSPLTPLNRLVRVIMFLRAEVMMVLSCATPSGKHLPAFVVFRIAPTRIRSFFQLNHPFPSLTWDIQQLALMAYH
jgi:hypothetical protein